MTTEYNSKDLIGNNTETSKPGTSGRNHCMLRMSKNSKKKLDDQ